MGEPRRICKCFGQCKTTQKELRLNQSDLKFASSSPKSFFDKKNEKSLIDDIKKFFIRSSNSPKIFLKASVLLKACLSNNIFFFSLPFYLPSLLRRISRAEKIFMNERISQSVAAYDRTLPSIQPENLCQNLIRFHFPSFSRLSIVRKRVKKRAPDLH